MTELGLSGIRVKILCLNSTLVFSVSSFFLFFFFLYDNRIIKVILIFHEGLSNKHISGHQTYNPQEEPEDGFVLHSLLFRNQDKTAAVHISSFNASYQERSVKAQTIQIHTLKYSVYQFS